MQNCQYLCDNFLSILRLLDIYITATLFRFGEVPSRLSAANLTGIGACQLD